MSLQEAFVTPQFETYETLDRSVLEDARAIVGDQKEFYFTLTGGEEYNYPSSWHPDSAEVLGPKVFGALKPLVNCIPVPVEDCQLMITLDTRDAPPGFAQRANGIFNLWHCDTRPVITVASELPTEILQGKISAYRRIFGIGKKLNKELLDYENSGVAAESILEMSVTELQRLGFSINTAEPNQMYGFGTTTPHRSAPNLTSQFIRKTYADVQYELITEPATVKS